MPTPGLGMVRESSLQTKGVKAGLERRAWNDAMLMAESLQEDPIYGIPQLTGRTISIGEKPVALPASIIVDVTPKDKSARRITVPFKRALAGAGIEGVGTDLPGNEENYRLKYSDFYANDWKHGVAIDQYGTTHREQLDVLNGAEARKDIAIWLGEKRGMWIRQALCERHSSPLTQSPISLTQTINPNVYVLGAATQPVYDKDKADWDNAVGAALAAATDANMTFTIARLLDLIDEARDRYIMPVPLPGGITGYILTASPAQVTANLDPATTGGWASYYVQAAAIQDLKKVIPGARIVIRDCLVIVEDRRCPTLISAGNASSNYTNTFGYVGPGRSTSRTSVKGQPGYYDANILLGKGAVGKYEPELPHYRDQEDNYEQHNNKGYFGTVGYSLIMNDIDTATDTSMQHEGSMLIPTYRA
jgi:hypothetical protein